jgi:hypothetical protein
MAMLRLKTRSPLLWRGREKQAPQARDVDSSDQTHIQWKAQIGHPLLPMASLANPRENSEQG